MRAHAQKKTSDGSDALDEEEEEKRGSNSSSITLAEGGRLRAQRALQRRLHVRPGHDVAMEIGAGRAHALDGVERELLVPQVELRQAAHEGFVGAEPPAHGVLLLPHHQQALA